MATKKTSKGEQKAGVKKSTLKDLSVGTKSGGVKGGRKDWTTK